VTSLGTNQIVERVFADSVLEGGRVESTGLLLLILGYATAFEVLAGYATAWLARREEMQHALGLALVQLTLGVIATIAYLETAPLWYHVGVLSLVIPAVMLGGMLRVVQLRRMRGEHPATPAMR
jgi:hypothetical protein